MDKEKLLEHLSSELDDCETYLRSFCVNTCDDFQTLASTPKEDLPTLINEPGPLGEWASARLQDPTEEQWDCPACWIGFLCNVSFDYEQYRDLGVNDGKLKVLGDIYDFLGMKEEAQKAWACIYED